MLSEPAVQRAAVPADGANRHGPAGARARRPEHQAAAPTPAAHLGQGDHTLVHAARFRHAHALPAAGEYTFFMWLRSVGLMIIGESGWIYLF